MIDIPQFQLPFIPNISTQTNNITSVAVFPTQNSETILSQVPNFIRSAAIGSILSGIVNRNQGGVVNIHTNQGNIVANTLLPLEKGNHLTFRVIQNGTEPKLQIQTINNQPALEWLNQVKNQYINQYPALKNISEKSLILTPAANSSDPEVISKIQAQQNNQSKSKLDKTNITENYSDKIITSYSSTLKKNDNVNAIPLNLKHDNFIQIVSNLTENKFINNNIISNLNNVNYINNIVNNIIINLQIKNIVPALLNNMPNSTPTPHSDIAQNNFKAIVISNDVKGETIIKSEFGNIKILSEQPLEKNVIIEFSINNINIENSINILNNNINREEPILKLLHYWRNLDDSLEILKFINQKTEQPLESSEKSNFSDHHKIIPNVKDNNFTSNMAQFIHYLSNNDLSSWFKSENFDKLQDEGFKNLVKFLNRDFNVIHNAFSHQSDHNWQSILIPFYDDQEYQQLKWFFREENQKKDKETRKNRFIVEVELNNYGEIQIDGYYRKMQDNRNLDLIIRSKIEFSDVMKRDIKEIFSNISEISGFKGNIVFQSMISFPVNPIADIESSNNFNNKDNNLDDLIV